MHNPQIAIEEFTDPACPWAYSAEPIRWRLRWRFGEQITSWKIRLVGLARDRETQERKGFTPERLRAVRKHFETYGMPLYLGELQAPSATWPACRAIVAVRQHAPGSEFRLLRELQIGYQAHGRVLDDPTFIDEAAQAAGISPGDIKHWLNEAATDAAFRADLVDSRNASPVALALDYKLARVEDDWDGGGSGWRYTCPSYIFAANKLVYETPGFHPWLSVETAIANLEPALERRPWADDPLEVLQWAKQYLPGQLLATQEIAEVMNLKDREEARSKLTAVGAVEHKAGNDAFWTSPDLTS